MTPEEEYQFYSDPEHLKTAGSAQRRKPVIAFDVDGTLFDEQDQPRWDVIDMLRNLSSYCTIVVWSGSGTDYARMKGARLYLPDKVIYLRKGEIRPAICFDDQDVTLADVNIKV